MNDKEGSRQIPNILGYLTSGMRESSMSILGLVLAWCVYGVTNVTEDFGVEISKELSLRYTVISSMELFRLIYRSVCLVSEYGCMLDIFPICLLLSTHSLNPC